ncbi:MAG: glycosyltransferase family 39 protein [Candidatus Bathyarchaeota archaeon]|nr:glycosyltransferase family 39 protein [Candidatus Bathyarchaeota archaeon]MDI9578375.1 glycosyltransferase family 39 protein [Thermoproteota archaeon]
MIVFSSAAVYALGYMSVQWDEMPHLFGGTLLSRMQTWDYMTTYAYYPPLFDLVTTAYFIVFGVNEVAGRLVAVTFSVLAILIVFEFTKRMHGEKKALVASVFLGTMPGLLWLSRVTMLETMLIFFFTLVMFTFYQWLSKDTSNRALLFSGLVLGIGILAKYQIIVSALAMLLCILFLSRKKLKINFAKFFVIIIIVVLVVAPWFFMIYHYNGIEKFETILYVMGEGGQDRPAYSNRFQPIPVFYLVEMTWPFNDIPVHPISLPIFILGLCGLGLFAYRRNRQDIFLLTWFLVVYVFFTVIPNRQWRYVTPLFPILAIAAANFVMFLYGKVERWKPKEVGIKAIRLKKIASVTFILIITFAVAYSCHDAYQMTARDQIHIPIQEATNYLIDNLSENQSAVIVCAYNLLNQDMFRFYLPARMSSQQIWQYPELAVDAFTPNFSISEFVDLCVERNVKYIVLYDYGIHTEFFNTTLDYTQVRSMIAETGRFGDPLDQPFWGEYNGWMGYRIFLVRFLG